MVRKVWTKARRAKLSAAMKASHAAKRGAPAPTGVSGEVGGPVAAEYTLAAAGYDVLAHELHEAFKQSAHGKGKERHANGRPFDRQPILELTRLYGAGFSAGQAAKKTQEALGMANRGEIERAIHEVHGAIVYLAAVAHYLRNR